MHLKSDFEVCGTQYMGCISDDDQQEYCVIWLETQGMIFLQEVIPESVPPSDDDYQVSDEMRFEIGQAVASIRGKEVVD